MSEFLILLLHFFRKLIRFCHIFVSSQNVVANPCGRPMGQEQVLPLLQKFEKTHIFIKKAEKFLKSVKIYLIRKTCTELVEVSAFYFDAPERLYNRTVSQNPK